MNPPSIIALVLVGVCFIAAVVYIIKHKNSCGGCSGNCAGCPGCSSCREKRKTKKSAEKERKKDGLKTEKEDENRRE